MSNKTEIKKYEKKLSDLLDELVFFTSDVTNNEYMRREDFENDFKQLVEIPFMYFLHISKDTDNSIADELLKEFMSFGGGAKGAYKVIKQDIHQVHLGRTLDFIKDGTPITIDELMQHASPSMKRVIADRAKENDRNTFEAELCNSINPFVEIKADNLLALEQGLQESLETVREWLSVPYSADNDMSVREVLSNLVAKQIISSDYYKNIFADFNKKLENVVRSNGGIELLTHDKKSIDYVQLLHAHGLYGIETDSSEIIQIIELQQSTATGIVYAICEEYDDVIELDFDFIGTKEACYHYLYGEDYAEY